MRGFVVRNYNALGGVILYLYGLYMYEGSSMGHPRYRNS
jgi:hypothetical protein